MGTYQIYLENIKKTYKDPKELVVFENLCLKIIESEIVAIIGPSGSGKTTLLNLIGVIDNPDEGTIEILGKDIRNLNENEKANFRNENIGFIFQMPHLVNELTIFENVLIPSLIKYKFLNGNVKKRAIELLEYMELAQKKDNFPFEISGGERRRVEIARALMNSPKIIIADEPTANLDPNLKFSIMDLIYKIRKDFKTTIIFSTHDYEILKYADKIYKIENRKLKLISEEN
ncbi:MAG: ABC transporter ATP-binding protein [candidate division WOR-3 bacterium]|jgi:ABC-type lipoprotein export system ATPase subunit